MLKNFEVELKDLTGNPAIVDSKPVTIAKLCIDALLANFPDDANLSGSDKMNRYNLAMKLSKPDKKTGTEVSSEDLSLIKNCVSKYAAILFMGQIFDFIEGK